MSWYEKRFPNGSIAFSERGRLHEFTEVFAAFAETRRGAAFFARSNRDGSATAYFTPVSAEFAIMIQADPMASAPASEGLMLVCGNPSDLLQARSDRDCPRRARRG